VQAEITLSAGQPEEALAMVNQVPDMDGHFEDALLCRARYYLISEDIDAAVTDLRVILRNNPRSERALVMLGNAYVTSGSQQLADDTFRQVLDINPGNIQAAVPVIKGLLEKQDSDRSEQIIENALVYSPDNEVLLAILAQIKLSNQEIEAGQQVISKIHASGQNPAFGHYLSGRALQSQGNYKQAIASYKQALAINSELTRALENLAHSYTRLDQQGALLDYLQAFSEQHPDNLSVFSIMAAVQRQLKDFAAAIATLERGLQRQDKWVGGYSALAVNHVSMGNTESAIETYKLGLVAVPNSNLLKMLLASLYEKVQAYAEAKALYESVLATNPDHHAVLNNLASLLTDQFESRENISRAVALTERFTDSDQPFFIDTYAWALVKSGLPQVAEPLFAKATELAPNIAVFHYHRAIGFKQLGRLEDAKKALMLAQAKVSAQDPLRRAIESELASL
jgi:tetratricopeptide (TPR) repeat protein